MTAMAVSDSVPRKGARLSSLKRNRRWALVTSYVFLVMFAIFFLIPPYYMIVTALKSDAEVARMAVILARLQAVQRKVEAARTALLLEAYARDEDYLRVRLDG